jgi:flagellar motor protein MotB
MRAKTGTRFRSQLCMTKGNWELGSERAKAEAREMIDGHKAAIQ